MVQIVVLQVKEVHLHFAFPLIILPRILAAFFEVFVYLVESVETRRPIELTGNYYELLVGVHILIERLLGQVVESICIYLLQMRLAEKLCLLRILLESLSFDIFILHSRVELTPEKIEHKVGNDAWVCDHEIVRLGNVRFVCWEVVAFGDLATEQIVAIQLQKVHNHQARQIMIIDRHIHQIKQLLRKQVCRKVTVNVHQVFVYFRVPLLELYQLPLFLQR